MKKEINKFINRIVKEIKKREKYYSNKSESWKATIQGDKYIYYTDMLYDLMESIQTSRCYSEWISN